jgi:hypothetical protein
MKITSLLTLFILTLTSLNFNAQNNLPRLSPKSFVGQTIGYTKVVIHYGSPGVKGRTIWGELVPYGEVWRTGANEATTIEFDKDVYIEGKLVPEGKYSLFTIPGEEEWTVILNEVYDQWGAYKYDKEKDILRFTIEQRPNHYIERLTFRFEYKDGYISNVVMEWENIKISFEINSELASK